MISGFSSGKMHLTSIIIKKIEYYREPEKSAGKMQGAIFTLDDATGLCVGVERVDVR